MAAVEAGAHVGAADALPASASVHASATTKAAKIRRCFNSFPLPGICPCALVPTSCRRSAGCSLPNSRNLEHTSASPRIHLDRPRAASPCSGLRARHVVAVLPASGRPLAYPLLLPYLRRNHPRAMPGVHDIQFKLNRWLTGPGTVLILAFGIYMASKRELWGEAWVQVGLGVIVVIGAVGGAVIVPASRRMSELAGADLQAAGGGALTWSAEYDRVWSRYLAAEILLGALVVLAVFVMTAKPFS